jgi:hypothetical protein
MIEDDGLLPIYGEPGKPYRLYRVLRDGALECAGAFDTVEELKAHAKRPDWHYRVSFRRKFVDMREL